VLLLIQFIGTKVPLNLIGMRQIPALKGGVSQLFYNMLGQMTNSVLKRGDTWICLDFGALAQNFITLQHSLLVDEEKSYLQIPFCNTLPSKAGEAISYILCEVKVTISQLVLTP